MVAALFVRRDSVYKSMPGVDAWDARRDARLWPGGCPVVAHPPCRSWGSLRHFAKPEPGEKELGPYAVGLVREWGGVLVPVLQSWWGHRAPKKTLLYIVGPIPDLSGVAPGGPALRTVESMCRREREVTPRAFAEMLVAVARAAARARVRAQRPDGQAERRTSGRRAARSEVDA